MKKTALLLALLAVAPAASAQQVFVDALNGSDTTGNGTSGSPYQTIAKGVLSLASVSGPTTVHVAPGTYGPSTGEAFPIVLAAQMTIQGAGASRTLVSGEGNGLTLFALGRETVVSDVTLSRADVAIDSGGPGFTANVRLVRRCVVRDSKIGLRCHDNLHADYGTIVLNSAFFANDVAIEAESTGFDFQSTSVLVYGSTITANLVALSAFGVLERYLGLFDSIVYGNGNDAIAGWTAIFPGITGNVLGDPTYVGTNGNVGTNPGLVGPAAGDWHLRVTSPVIDNPAPAVSWPPAPKWIGAASWIWEPTFGEIPELDGDDRIGVIHDPGADEFVLPTLYPHGRTRVGQTFDLRATANPNELVPMFASAGVLAAPLGGFFWLASPALPLATPLSDADGLVSVPIAVPAVPAWIGLDAYVQAFRAAGGGVYDESRPLWIRLLP